MVSRSPRAWLAVGILVSTTLGRAQGAPASKKEGQRGSPRLAVFDLARDFDGAAREAFFRRVDPDVFPDFEEFRDEVLEFLLTHRQTSTNVVVDSELKEGDRGSVRFHWNQSYVNKAGVPQLEKGRCEFLFRKRGGRGWLLTSIRGDSPF